MLQEATKLINSAFNNSFIKKLSLYLHDCVREEVKSSTFRNLKQDKDNKWHFLDGEEMLLSSNESVLKLDGADSLVTELMINADTSKKEKYLIYGYLFLKGRHKRSGEFLTPILYAPCKLERDGLFINCSLMEDFLSLNTGALSALLQKSDDEDEVDERFDGLIDVIPDLPLNDEKIQIFLTTLKSIIPDIDVSLGKVYQKEISQTEEEYEQKCGIKVTKEAAIILTKRPSVTAGVLHELTLISEKPSGVIRETALDVVNQEFIHSSSKAENSQNPISKSKNHEFFPITPLASSDSQENVIKMIEENPWVTVYGPPGTGKSQTIANVVSHLVANGKTVLVASRMDKAVDVVADRLNSLGAPYMSLRAGRIDYQKNLHFKLQDLLSNKVDIDTGYEDCILVTLEDMKNLVKTIKELETKCENIIKLEKDWTDILEEQSKLLKKIEEKIISKKLNNEEIKQVSSLLNKIEQRMEKTGIINSILKKIDIIRFNKTTELKKFKPDFDNIDEVKKELELQKLNNDLRHTECDINKIGNLHQLIDNIRLLKRKQKKLAVDILKNQRRESLKSVLRDQHKRQRLMIHSKALIERKKNLQSRLLEDEDFQPLLDTFPCWAVTTYAISESLPLKPGLFDVAIIDEASQCDIASCFPVLFRAKKAIIVGDDKQLAHLSFLEKNKEQSFLSQYNIPDRYQLMWRFRTNSIFDLANYYSANPVLLDEHFRCLSPIIDFSNREFYGGRIRLMKKEDSLEGCLEVHVVEGAKVDLDSTRNMAEAEQVLKKIQEIIIEDNEKNPDKPVSIGVISPFRAQVDLIKKALWQVMSEDLIRKHQIEVGTAHTFQGDEKDVMILSFTVAENSHFQSITFLQKPNLFNVAITRAKKKVISYISRPVESLAPGLLRSYLEYVQQYQQKKEEEKLDVVKNTFSNKLQKKIAEECEKEGFKVKTNVEIAGVQVSLLVEDKNSYEKVIVECDGVDDGCEKPVKPIWKQLLLERCSWKVIRITAREWHYSKKVCLDRIKQELGYMI